LDVDWQRSGRFLLLDTERTANMSYRTLAKELGLSVAQTHKLSKRGMPQDPEAARAWRRAHIVDPRSKQQTILPELRADLSSIKERIAIIPERPDTLAEAEKIFLELTFACNVAASRAKQLTGSKEPAVDELGRRWSLLCADLLKRKLEVIERVQTLRVQSGELVLFAEAREKFTSFLQDIRRLALSLPVSMAVPCNPKIHRWPNVRLMNGCADSSAPSRQAKKLTDLPSVEPRHLTGEQTA
jgi:hypothetical protein